jgi:hypothetical protein
LALALALAKLHVVSSVLNQMALVCVCGAPLPPPPPAHGLGAFSARWQEWHRITHCVVNLATISCGCFLRHVL